MLKRTLSGLLLLGLLLGLVGLGGFAYLLTAPMPAAALPAEFSVPPGSSLRAVAALLEEKGVLTRPGVFVLWARGRGQAGQIKAGSYSVERAISVRDLLGKLTRGDTLLGKLTVVEGWSFRQMRAAIAAEPRLRGGLHRIGHPVLEFGDHRTSERRRGVESHRAFLQRRHLEGPRQAADARPLQLIGERDPFGRLYALLRDTGVFGLRAPGRALRHQGRGTAGKRRGEKEEKEEGAADHADSMAGSLLTLRRKV